MAKASANLYPYVHLVPAAAPASPAAGAERIYLDSGDGNKLKRKNSAGTVTTIEGGSGGSGQGLVDFARAKRTSGNITVNSTTFVNVDTGLDLVMTATTGDVIEVALSVNVEAASASYIVFDFATLVSAAVVNSVSTESAAGTGITGSFAGWGRGSVGASPNGQYINGSKRYTLQSGDISGGTVTLRLRALCGASMTVKAVDPMLYVQATNLGQPL